MPYICLSDKSFAQIAAYATVYGMSNERAASKAVSHWWDEVGAWSVADAQKKGIGKRRRRRLKAMPMVLPVVLPVLLPAVLPGPILLERKRAVSA